MISLRRNLCCSPYCCQQDGLTQVELSEKGHIDRSTLGGLVDRLERNRLLERHKHPLDRRAYRIYLTEQGKAMENILSDCAERSLKRFTSGLNSDDVKELRRILEILSRRSRCGIAKKRSHGE